jgi:hypothetical protein
VEALTIEREVMMQYNAKWLSTKEQKVMWKKELDFCSVK